MTAVILRGESQPVPRPVPRPAGAGRVVQATFGQRRDRPRPVARPRSTAYVRGAHIPSLTLPAPRVGPVCTAHVPGISRSTWPGSATGPRGCIVPPSAPEARASFGHVPAPARRCGFHHPEDPVHFTKERRSRVAADARPQSKIQNRKCPAAPRPTPPPPTRPTPTPTPDRRGRRARCPCSQFAIRPLPFSIPHAPSPRPFLLEIAGPALRLLCSSAPFAVRLFFSSVHVFFCCLRPTQRLSFVSFVPSMKPGLSRAKKLEWAQPSIRVLNRSGVEPGSRGPI